MSSILKIKVDHACQVYCDYEFVGDAVPEKLFKLELRKGTYILEFKFEGETILSKEYAMQSNDEEDLIKLGISTHIAKINLKNRADEAYTKDAHVITLDNKYYIEDSQSNGRIEIPRLKGGMDSSLFPSDTWYVEFDQCGLLCGQPQMNTFFDGQTISSLKYGAINKNGEIQIPFKFDFISGFRTKYASEATLYGKSVLIDRLGSVIYESEYDTISYFHDKYFLVRKDDKKGLISYDGTLVLDTQYNDISLIQINTVDFILVKVNNKYGLFDSYFNQALEPICDSIKSLGYQLYSSKYIAIQKNGMFYITDNTLVPIGGIYERVSYMSNLHTKKSFISVTQNDKTGILDENLNVLVPIIYEIIDTSWGKNKVVKRDGKIGMVNYNLYQIGDFDLDSFAEIIPCKYDKYVQYNNDVFVFSIYEGEYLQCYLYDFGLAVAPNHVLYPLYDFSCESYLIDFSKKNGIVVFIKRNGLWGIYSPFEEPDCRFFDIEKKYTFTGSHSCYIVKWYNDEGILRVGVLIDCILYDICEDAESSTLIDIYCSKITDRFTLFVYINGRGWAVYTGIIGDGHSIRYLYDSCIQPRLKENEFIEIERNVNGRWLYGIISINDSSPNEPLLYLESYDKRNECDWIRMYDHKQKKEGLVSKNGSVIMPFVYDIVFFCLGKSPIFIVGDTNGRFALMDSKRKYISEYIFANLEPCPSNEFYINILNSYYYTYLNLNKIDIQYIFPFIKFSRHFETECNVYNPYEHVTLYIDTETTGLPKDRTLSFEHIDNWPRLVQVAFIIEDSKLGVLCKRDIMVKPNGFTIPSTASQIHGITTDMANKEGEEYDDVIPYLDLILSNSDVIVGHNVEFDLNVIKAEILRCKGKDNALFYKKDSIIQDTMKLGTDICKIAGVSRYGYKPPKLKELYRHLFGKEFEDQHNAMADIQATYACYKQMTS